MGFLKKLFSGSDKKVWQDETSEAIFIYSQCDKCQEKFRNRIDKRYDLMTNYADSGPAYTAHKEIIGARCRSRIVVDLEFNQQKRLTEKAIQNGRFLTREEYEGNAESDSEQ